MNPSSSSNAEPAGATAFQVLTRGLSADLTAAGSDQSPRDLGTMPAARLEEILARVGALDPALLVDLDPHLVIRARGGRFTVRPHRGRWLVQSTGGTGADYIELATAEVAPYVDQPESIPSAAEPAVGAPATGDAATKTRLGLVFVLLFISALALTSSAYFTFRPYPIDPDSAYEPIAAAAQLAALKAQVVGRFATGSGAGERELEIGADGTVVWRDFGAGDAPADERRDTYTLALRDGRTFVARATHLGPIEVRDSRTLVYAGENYLRLP